jgi:glycosyltransferase involved in cell wall biosynthesis
VIVLLHGAPAFGAVERYLVSVAEGLREAGVDAAIVHPDVPELAPFAETGIRTVPLDPALVAGSTPRLVAALRRTLRELQPTIVHVNDTWPAAVVAARLAGVRRVLLTHHTPELRRHDNLAGRALSQLGWLARPTVIYTSDADRKTDGRRFLSTAVVPLGIDIERFANARPARTWGGPTVGNVARLVEQKGHRTLIEAAKIVRERKPDTQFVIVGDGELRDELEALAGALVTFTGARDDVPELLASFDVFAFPSRFEGLCLAVIEAQAAGVPVVATPVGGIVETVVPGETGVLCAPENAQSLADGILHLLDHPEQARALAEEARRRARARYSEQQAVQATLRLYGVEAAPARPHGAVH